jgi:hypothetical protein
MENVGLFYGHLVYFVAICYILSRFGTLCLEQEQAFALWLSQA